MYLNKDTFAIDFAYNGTDYYALVIPGVEENTKKKFYEVMIPWLTNFTLVEEFSNWSVKNGVAIAQDLLEAVTKEVKFMTSIK